jgi:hypothetical protein
MIAYFKFALQTAQVLTVCDYLKITKKYLKVALQGQDVFVKQVFKNQSDFDKAFGGVDDLIVDCTEIPVQRPDNQDIQRKFSAKCRAVQLQIEIFNQLIFNMLTSKKSISLEKNGVIEGDILYITREFYIKGEEEEEDEEEEEEDDEEE